MPRGYAAAAALSIAMLEVIYVQMLPILVFGTMRCDAKPPADEFPADETGATDRAGAFNLRRQAARYRLTGI